MRIYRAEIHGHLVEARHGDFGGETVLVDGRMVSRRLLAGWLPKKGHHFELKDEKGVERHVEVRVVQPSLGLGTVRAVILVDGAERCRLDPMDENAKPTACLYCGYELAGQRAENGEVRCPECGRHTGEKMLGR